MIRIVALIIVALTTSFTAAQIPGFGGCPSVHVVHEFSVDRYLGVWYEVMKYPFIFTLGGKCVTAEYGLTDDGKVSVFNRQIRNGKENTITGSAKQTQLGAGDLSVSFPSVPCKSSLGMTICRSK